MERIELSDGAWLELDRAWLSAQRAHDVAEALLREIPFEPRAIRIFGREVMQPRLVAWMGDAEAVYTYSGVRHDPLPWTPTLAALRAELQQRTQLTFNSVLCNLYRDGRDSMGLHSDSEPELGPDPIVASLSLGAPRRFQLRHRKRDHKLQLTLDDGCLLVMCGTTQSFYRHAVPKQPGLDAARINLTFRRIV
jgi:alkylated DNA repair dioxygenase AlkB